ncbi:MAG TPA: tetratricopeptide repeat protein [Bryobacteraceae bacterium]|nr:tetratricopeptide repeat protein [Bryobacteraceae bacterium]
MWAPRGKLIGPKYVGALCCLLAVAASAQPQADREEKAKRARELVLAGKTAEAIPIYAELARSAPGDPSSLLNLAIAEFKSKRFQDSAEHAQAALRLEPASAAANLFLGASYAELGEHSKAVGALEQAVALGPNDRNALVLLAEELLALGRDRDAAERFLKASELAPQNPKVWFGLGRSYEALAEESVQRLKSTAADSAYCKALTGDMFLKQRRYGNAFPNYKQALAAAPGLHGVHAALAMLYERTGHPDWAQVEKQRERDLPPADCSTDRLACEYLAGGYRKILESSRAGGSAEAMYWSAKSAIELAREAYRHLEQLPPSREYYFHVAQDLDSEAEYRQAAEQWRHALKMAPDDFDLQLGLVWSLYRSGNSGDALPVLAQLLQARPKSKDVNFLYGATLLAMEQPEKAVAYLETAAHIDADFLPARAALGQALLRAGRAADAIPHLQASLGSDEDGSTHFQLFRAYQLTGQTELAQHAKADYEQVRRSFERAKRTAEAGGITAP